MKLSKKVNKVYLLLGSNIGDTLQKINLAKKLIEKHIGICKASSSIYLTKAWGREEQSDFLNQVIEIETLFSALDCLQKILAIENMMGRIRTVKNAPRIIDIDILFYNNEIINKQSLVVPHPEIQNRRFVLTPLNEISPSFVHPLLKKSIHTLLTICIDPLPVKILS